MTGTLEKILTEALIDEYKARASYRLVIDTFGEQRPFTKIVEAEGRHIEALLALFKKYAIDVPADDWHSRIEAPSSIQEACRLGMEAELENESMYERLLDSTKDYPDAHNLLEQLQRASKENHLPAFRHCLERESKRNWSQQQARKQRWRGRQRSESEQQ